MPRLPRVQHVMSGRGVHGWLARVGAATALSVMLITGSAHGLSDADKETLGSLALQWAVDGGIGDVQLLKQPTSLIVVAQHLPSRARLQVPNRTVALWSVIRIQAQADIAGDFLYFRIGPFESRNQRVRVPIKLEWAISVKEHHLPYLSGGGAILEFQQKDGKWERLPVVEQWSS